MIVKLQKVRKRSSKKNSLKTSLECGGVRHLLYVIWNWKSIPRTQRVLHRRSRVHQIWCMSLESDICWCWRSDRRPALDRSSTVALTLSIRFDDARLVWCIGTRIRPDYWLLYLPIHASPIASVGVRLSGLRWSTDWGARPVNCTPSVHADKQWMLGVYMVCSVAEAAQAPASSSHEWHPLQLGN